MNHKRRAILFTALATFAIPTAVFAGATPPSLVSYQGVLRNASGLPLTGSYDMVFRFVDAASGGTLLLTDYHTGPNAVVVSGGLFAVLLGGGTISPGTESTLLDVFSNRTSVYVEVQVGSETMSPRVQVVSAGYALNAGRVGGLIAGDFLDKSATAQEKSGRLTANGGLVGNASASAPGVEGTTQTGSGVRGHATATSGNGYGVYGISDSSAGVGVLGSALAATGSTEGVRGQSASTAGRGVVGGAFATSGPSCGVYGETQSTEGTGVYGHAIATAGYTTGVGGESFSPVGTGVAGIANASSGDAWGVYGATMSPQGWGVVADGGAGVNGDLFVTGAKNFLIEHPTEVDRAIRYACIEGGEVGIYHRGTARLNAGEVHVGLPSHFGLLASGHLTVQVTPLEACGGLYVPEESIGPDGFTVREAGAVGSNAAFSYLVMAERTGYEGSEPVRPLSIREKILISKRLDTGQRVALRQALAREGSEKLDAGARAQVYASLHGGDYDGACRALGGCLEKPIGTPKPGLLRSPEEGAATNPPSSVRIAPSGQPRNVPPDLRTPAAESPLALREATSYLLRTEPHPVSEVVEAGDVVVLDRINIGALRLGTAALDPGVVGIVADVPGAVPAGGEAPIALAGTVSCKADAAFGAIAAGDLLGVSPTPGHAMRALDAMPGTIVGKAMEPLAAGRGVIKVLLMLR